MINSRSLADRSSTRDFANETQGRPDNVADVAASAPRSARGSTSTGSITLGLLTVPAPIAGQTAFNAFVQPLIDRYGYVEQRRHDRRRHGRLRRRQFDENDFFRNAGQIAYNLTFGSARPPRPPRRLSALSSTPRI